MREVSIVSKLKFDRETIEELRKNPNVKRVSESSITYSEEFKEYFVNESAKGVLPNCFLFCLVSCNCNTV